MIARLDSVVFDCRDPHAMARFYSELLGWPIVRVDGDWVDIGGGQAAQMSFQHAPEHQAPRWPDPKFPQQVHLDLSVDDIDEAEPKVLALGATLLSSAEPGFRVYADPEGYPTVAGLPGCRVAGLPGCRLSWLWLSYVRSSIWA